MSLTWNGTQAQSMVLDLATKRLEAAAIYLVNSIREEVSRPGTGQRTTSLPRRGSRPGRRKGSRIYGFVRSRPGEPPRKQTGHLRRSITHELDRKALVVRVGTNLIYGRHLEMGTARLRARPFIRPTLTRIRPILDRIIKEGRLPQGMAAKASWA